ncbi:MAG TPA: glycerol-3-phosphate acyltransferase [Dehalococcoidia bacterium]|nr:glycerol-3-phosphate acyltransferase [Dehalococcoidia bacterium]
MLAASVAIGISYLIGSLPLALLAGRLRGIDLRAYGSGNPGASNVWQSVSHALVVPVGLAQVGQGLAGVYIARALGGGDGVRVAAGLAAIVAYDWNPWLQLRGGRGIGPSIGFLLALAPWTALPAFIVIAVAGMPFNQSPLSVALALVIAPIAAAAGGEHAAIVTGCVMVTGVALVKRVLANGRPATELARPAVWFTRLLHDRDIADREAWIHRGMAAARGASQHR